MLYGRETYLQFVKGAQTRNTLLCYFCGGAWVARLRRCSAAFSDIFVSMACNNVEKGVV